MNILYWILFGLITGSVAEFIAPSSRGGFGGSIILGIIGVVVGSYLGPKFFGVGITGFNLPSFGVAVVGSLLVLFIGRMI